MINSIIFRKLPQFPILKSNAKIQKTKKTFLVFLAQKG